MDPATDSRGALGRLRAKGAERRALTRAIDDPVQPLLTAGILTTIADTFVTVSLADSLFFNLSPDASREQVLIYLFTTLAPLAVLAPLIGPAVDRFRTSQRALAVGCVVLRAFFCLAMAASLFRLSFFGFALGFLFAGRASGIVKQALVPLLVDRPDQLVSTNARFARRGAVAGAIGAALGVLLLQLTSATFLLRTAAVVFVVAAFITRRLRPQAPAAPPSLALARVEPHSPTITVGSIAFMAIRAACGFFVFMLAFAFRRASEPAWVYGAAGIAYGAGGFLGSTIAPLLRRRFRDEQLIAIALAAPAIPTVVGILGVSRPLLLTVAGLIGVSTTLGRHGFDSVLQARAQPARRGRVAARHETAFQLSWAFGAIIATPFALPAQVAMVVLGAFYVPALVVYVRAATIAERTEQRSTFDLVGLAHARLASAATALQAGSLAVAVVEAAAAADLAYLAIERDALGGAEPDGSERASDISDDRPESACAADERSALVQLRERALDPSIDLTAADADEAVALATRMISRCQPPTTR